MKTRTKSTTRDMTQGSIVKQLVLFALPLFLGNIFQLLYNTVDSIVVGNFVGTQALAAVGSTTMIINIMVFFFNGMSIGAGVVISRYFGAKDDQNLHRAVETTMVMTFVMGVFCTILGLLVTRPMLVAMSTPEDVMDSAVTYLTVYFAGISGLLIYNMGSGVLRAVGDTVRPLYFLVFTSCMNIVLDLLFVIVFHGGVAGVGYATILSQFISAALVLMVLSRSEDVYRLTWSDLRADKKILMEVFAIGLPTGIQSMITAFSNVFVQGYINVFGSACMAGWSCYNKLDQFIFLPMQSIAAASTTFVGQNMGAKKYDRVNKGTWQAVFLSAGITFVIAGTLLIFARETSGLFTKDDAVLDYAVIFMHMNNMFLVFNAVNHTLAGGLRGRGDSRGPMIIMLLTFVLSRQIYLFVVTRFFANTVYTVGFGYPVGWMLCCAIEMLYFFVRYGRKPKNAMQSAM